MKRILITVLVIVVVAVLACQKTEQAATAPAAPAPAPSPMGSMASATTSVAYDLPAAWTRVQPTSSMRLDQAAIPGEGGNGELAVFFFGAGGGGGVEANLQRWSDQMDSSSGPARESFDVGDYRVTWIDVTGTLQPSSMGMGPSDPQPNSRMFAAVVEGSGGPWFFKATGPASTMDAAREEFVTMLRSVRAGE